MSQADAFNGRHFAAEIILLGVRWSLRYSLSSRALEEIRLERGLPIAQPTSYRWVPHAAPALDRRGRPHLKVTTASWHVEET